MLTLPLYERTLLISIQQIAGTDTSINNNFQKVQNFYSRLLQIGMRCPRVSFWIFKGQMIHTPLRWSHLSLVLSQRTVSGNSIPHLSNFHKNCIGLHQSQTRPKPECNSDSSWVFLQVLFDTGSRNKTKIDLGN